MVGPGPPPGGDVNRAAELLSFTWILCGFSLIFTILRFTSRTFLTRNLWWDDWTAFFTMACSVTFSIIWTFYAAKGFARHDYYLGPDQLANSGELSWVSQTFCIISIATGKVSVSFLIQRIQSPNKYRTWLLWFISISVSLSAAVAVILVYTQCTPFYALWNPQLVALGQAHCANSVDINTYDIFFAGYFAFLDFLLALIPITLIWPLQMSVPKKLLISTLLGFGILAGIFGTLKTSRLRTLTELSDISWITVDLFLWNSLEINLLIIAAAIPTLRPLFLVVFKLNGSEAYRSKNKKKSGLNSTGLSGRTPINSRSYNVSAGYSEKPHSARRGQQHSDFSQNDTLRSMGSSDGGARNVSPIRPARPETAAVMPGQIKRVVDVDVDVRYLQPNGRFGEAHDMV